jgi:hypothetical protein
MSKMHAPRLMFVYDGPITPEFRHTIRDAFDAALSTGKPLLVHGMKVYQLLDGEWRPLDPSQPLPRHRDGLNAVVVGDGDDAKLATSVHAVIDQATYWGVPVERLFGQGDSPSENPD